MATVEKKATVKRREQAITEFKRWVGNRQWDEISHPMKVKMFDHFVDKNSK